MDIENMTSEQLLALLQTECSDGGWGDPDLLPYPAAPVFHAYGEVVAEAIAQSATAVPFKNALRNCIAMGMAIGYNLALHLKDKQ